MYVAYGFRIPPRGPATAEPERFAIPPEAFRIEEQRQDRPPQSHPGEV